MHLSRIAGGCRALQRSSPHISWKPTGKRQQTIAAEVRRSGIGLHSGAATTARLLPAMAGEGRYFVLSLGRSRIPATIEHAVNSPLCTTLCYGGAMVRTVEHLLSALEVCGVDNCRIEIEGGEEVPFLDGSAKHWVEAIVHAGMCEATDFNGNTNEKMAPFLYGPQYVCRGDSFIIAFPSSKLYITYGINFPKVPAIGCQWFSCSMDPDTYSKEIASSRSFCIYEEIQHMHDAGLIQGGSIENALVCSAVSGWLNPPLRFNNEPCRHKILDLIGDFSLFARNGHQGLPFSHIIAYKAGHSMHVDFVRRLANIW
ncbi:probable UDP-3-O-acyl-N-acetylglucosamine deacetylase 2 [Phalaenopsis equestris]|uniref:probable UDP-3-O-acyl-N-acetylglucosamine deacetylase 2 n=1 Tax=Phalaenopsis equestris TaxID=78828 RepID=UPI0009E47F42|nr:probable UDP-3-O-acyl-N-acetylglucosamine deacetylase 2 [Phalaenopsis equestris]